MFSKKKGASWTYDTPSLNLDLKAEVQLFNLFSRDKY